MGRKRKSNLKLPPYVYLAKGRYIYRPYADGKLLPERRLCAGDAKTSEVWEAYEAQVIQNAGARTDTFGWLAQRYTRSDQFRTLKPRTQQGYRRFHDVIIARNLRDGRAFGAIAYADISPGAMRKYLDKRAQEGAPIAGNREAAFISAVFAWAYQRDYVKLNPCLGVRRNKEVPRKLYVTDVMYDFAYRLAEAASPYVRPAMELAYLCRMRKVEILALRVADLTDEGVLVRRVKGSLDGMTLWSPRLRAAIDTARALGPVKGLTVIHDRAGQPVRESSFDTAWQRLMVKLAQAGGLRFTFHDLKARGVSDFEGDKQQASGHKTPQMVQRYNRKLIVVESTR